MTRRALRSFDHEQLTSLGNALCRQGRLEEAIDAFQRAVSVDPCFRDAWHNLMVVYQVQGDIGKAVHACLRLLAFQPDDGTALYNLGLMYKELDREEDAICAFAAAEHYLTPDDAETATRLGAARLFQNHCETALGAFQRAVEFVDRQSAFDDGQFL